MSAKHSLPEPEENFQALIRLPPGFPVDDIEDLCSSLEEADPFVPAFEPADTGLYDMKAQLWSLLIEGNETVILPDRNIVSRMARMAMGDAIGKDAKVVAGITAFAHWFDMQIEPSIAFHELAPHDGNDGALQELAWFRAADHGDKADFLNVALGRSDRLAKPGTPRPLEAHDLAKDLRDWKTTYGAVLRLADIELNRRAKPFDKLMELLDWLHRDYFLSGYVAMMACVYFAPNDAPRGGLMKGLRSENRERAIDGAKNATWDAVYLGSLISKANEFAGGSKRFIYASLDRGAKRIARMALEFGAGGPHPDRMETILSEWWTPREASSIAGKLTQIVMELDTPAMEEKRRHASAAKFEMIAQGERAIRSWSPKRPAARGAVSDDGAPPPG
jgi:hypothetical protein